MTSVCQDIVTLCNKSEKYLKKPKTYIQTTQKIKKEADISFEDWNCVIFSTNKTRKMCSFYGLGRPGRHF